MIQIFSLILELDTQSLHRTWNNKGPVAFTLAYVLCTLVALVSAVI